MQTQGGRVWMALARMVRTRLWLAGEVSAQRDMPRLRRLIERGRRCAAHRPRVVDVERRMVDGTPARVETRRQRSHGDGVLNPADIERLNATFRARLASLTRRGRALPRCPLTLHHGMYLIGTVDNFCTPHASLSRVGSATTPAMATGITDYCWNVRELLSYHVPTPRWTPPKPRGRLSHALKCLMERWCGDHGWLWSYPTHTYRQKNADLAPLVLLLTFTYVPIFAIESPAGCEAPAKVMAERCAIAMLYERASCGLCAGLLLSAWI